MAPPKATSTPKELIRQPIDDTALLAIDEAFSDCRGVMTLANAGSMLHAIKLARGMTRLRDLITPEVMQEILPLMNSPLGFDTDRNPAKDANAVPYPEHAVKDCFMVATLKGARPVGNEFNIIASSAYLTKAAYKRFILEFEGLTEFRPEYGLPRMGDGSAVVPCKATWKLNGQSQSLAMDILVRLNKGMGADAAYGKAERKWHYRIHCLITGTEHDDVEDLDEPPNKGAGVINATAAVRETVQQTQAADKAHAQAEGSQVTPQPAATDDQANFADMLQSEINAAENCDQMKNIGTAIHEAINGGRITKDHAEKLRTHWAATNKALKAAEKAQSPLPQSARQPGDEA